MGHGEHIGSKSQEHSFAQVKIKVDIEFENWLHCHDELQSLGNPSYYITIISEVQTTKGREHFKDKTQKV